MLRKGCLWSIGLAAGLFLLGWIYLTLNPPFGSSETGYLSRREERRVTLPAAVTTATYAVTVGAKPAVYSSAHDRFEPLAVRVAARTDEGVPLAVHVLPADSLPVEGLTHTPDGGVATWQIDCQQPTEERPCPRRYLVVVASTAASSGEVDAELEVFAEQLFPKYAGTPFGVGIDVEIERREGTDADGWHVAETSGRFTLSPDAPVAGVGLVAAGMSPSGTGGILLGASIVRHGSAAPTGLAAPPPVRLALLDLNGSVVAELGVRPGAELAVAIPPGSGRHRLVAWWQDRADQAYDVSWQIRAAAAGVPGLRLSAEAEPPPMPIELAASADGVHDFGGPGAPEQAEELPLIVDIGLAGGSDRLPRMVGVLRLRLLLVDDDLREPVVVRLVPARDSAQASSAPVPIVLEPGVLRDVVLEATPGCPGAACPTWAFLPAERGAAGEPATGSILVEWQAVVHLWPLDPPGSSAQ